MLPEIETLRGVYAAVPLWISETDQAVFAEREAGLRDALLQRAQGEVINAWFEEHLGKAEIVDFRQRLRQRL